MSSRQLRKLQQQRELEQQAKLHTQEEEEEESDEEPQHIQPKPSLFAKLAALEDDEESKEDEEDEEDEEPEGEELSSPAPVVTAKKPTKSKKKKKGKNKGQPKESVKAPKDTQKDGLDEVDQALKELSLKQPNVTNTATTIKVDEEYERVCFLLGVNTQHLKVANEMRSLFGRAATENNEDPGGPTGRGARRRQRNQQIDLEAALRGHHAPGKELSLRRNFFIQGKDEWPKSSSGGLIMKIIDDHQVDGTTEYAFVHEAPYQATQQAFEALVEMGDPQNLIGFLQKNPYHISLLLQVSKIAKDQGDHSLSSDLVERALFIFGRISLSSFSTKLTQGKARLDFSRPENRDFWLAGFHYIKSLMMKGTYRTAFEWAKLLLSLDPKYDPYCMRWMIHHLALRAHEFQWLLDFAASRNVPVWAETINYAKPSFALAAQQLKDGAKCRSILSDCMAQVPWLFTRLCKEIDLDAPKSIWGAEPASNSDRLFTEMYVLQAKDLWNTPEATSLLMEVAHTIENPDHSKTPLLSDLKMDIDVVRFVYLDNRRELMSLVPSNILHRSNNSDSDPLPPYDNIISYSSQESHLQSPEDLSTNNYNDPLAALARLLPGFPGLEAFRGRSADDDSIDGGDDVDPFAHLEEQLNDELDLHGIPRSQESEGDDEEEGDDRQPRGPISLANAQRILNNLMFWRAQAYADSSESEEGDTDTDDDMPGLVQGEDTEGYEEHQGEDRQARVEDAEDEETT